MREGTASQTARSVAAHRLEFTRAAAGYGDPDADDELSRDVADGLAPRRGRMHEYLRARTAFFDRVLTDCLGQGVRQVVVGGAGYDGRALRYAKAGVRWFEVDHPATQADKRERLTRLGIAAEHMSFVPADFTADGVAEPLLAAGFDPGAPALFLFEGVAVYLTQPVTARVLAGFRMVAADGSLLAISVSVGDPDAPARARFRARVAELGEPARSVLTAGAATRLLADAGWEITGTSGRHQSAGLLLASAAPGGAAAAAAVIAAPATPVGFDDEGPDDEGPDGEGPDDEGPAREQPAPSRHAPPAPPRQASARGDRPQPVSPPEAAALPLSALLSQALVAFTIEADNEAEHSLPHRTTDYGKTGAWADGAWLTSLLMWANCLRFLPDDGITISELARRARTGTNLDGMRRWGYVTFTPDPGQSKRPAPDAVLAPTRPGMAARDSWPQVTAEVEARWRHRLGDERFDAFRAALVALVAQLDPALPDCLPILGPGLRDRAARQARRGSERGQGEARPAAGDGGGADPPARAADLPLWALLARALNAFARQYGSEPGPSLALSADILRVVSDDGVAVKDIPALGGISKEAVAMGMTAMREGRLATEGPDPAGSRYRFLRLTARGARAREEYPARAAGIEADWRARFGDNVITALRQPLEALATGDPPPLFAGLDPYPDNWRAQARPLTVLPHFPMTLHRGGYPDGS